MTSAGMMGPGGSYGSLDMRSDQYRRSGSWSAGETASSIGYSDDGISCPPATPVLGDLRSVAEHIRRYSQPFMAWGMCLTGLLAWGAVGPLYGCFPEDVREVPFRVGLWRNALALVPFAAFAGVKWARQGIGAEHRAYVTNPWNWPVLLLPGAGAFGSATLYFYSVQCTHQFALSAILSALHPYFLVVLEHCTKKPMRLPQFAALAFGFTGLVCVLTADRLQSLWAAGFAILSSLALAVYVTSNTVVEPRVPFPLLMSINFGVGLAIGVAGTFALEGTTVDAGPESLLRPLYDPATGCSAVAVGVAFIIGMSAFVACARHLSVVVVGAAVALAPETSIVLNLFAAPATRQPLPLGLMLLGLLLITTAKLFLGLEDAFQRRSEAPVDGIDPIDSSTCLLDTWAEGQPI